MLPNWPIEDPLIKMSLHGFYTALSSTWQQILRRRLHIIIARRFSPLCSPICSLPRSSYALHLVLTPRKIMTDRRLMVAGYRELRDVHCACTASFDPTKKLEFARLFERSAFPPDIVAWDRPFCSTRGYSTSSIQRRFHLLQCCKTRVELIQIWPVTRFNTDDEF